MYVYIIQTVVDSLVLVLKMRKIKYIIIGIVIGISVMLGLANVITTSFEENLLQNFSASALNQTNIVTESIYKELDAVQDIKDGICSQKDIDKLRFIVFQSRFAADIGRIVNNQIICTAGWGKINKPSSLSKPNLIENKDISYWPNTAGILPQITADMIARDNTVFFIAPTTFSLIAPADKQYNAVLFSQKNHFVITKTGNTNNLLDTVYKKAQETPNFSEGNTSYSTNCSEEYGYCVIASTKVGHIFTQPLPLVIALIIGGAFIGGILGWLLAIHRMEYYSYRKQLLRAIKKKNFQMKYQPIVRLSDKQIIGCEALVRWQNEDGENVSPEVFIKIAEKFGFINQITRIVVEKTLEEISPLLVNTDIPFYVSINLSMKDLMDKTFPDFLNTIVDKYYIPHEAIILEITERSPADLNLLNNAVNLLHQNGYRFYIDDFGTGYSNIGYLLKNLKIDAVKIDRTFTCLIGTDTIGAKIVDQVFTIIQSIGIKLIVEGIETENQIKYVSGIDADAYGQGYLFSKPISIQEITHLVSQSQQEIAA